MGLLIEAAAVIVFTGIAAALGTRLVIAESR